MALTRSSEDWCMGWGEEVVEEKCTGGLLDNKGNTERHALTHIQAHARGWQRGRVREAQSRDCWRREGRRAMWRRMILQLHPYSFLLKDKNLKKFQEKKPCEGTGSGADCQGMMHLLDRKQRTESLK